MKAKLKHYVEINPLIKEKTSNAAEANKHTLNQPQMTDSGKQCMLGQLTEHMQKPKPVYNEEKMV